MVESLEEAGFELFTRIIWHKCKIKRWYPSFYKICIKNGFRANINWSYVFVFRKYSQAKNRHEVKLKEWNEWSSGVWFIDFSQGYRSSFGHPATFSNKLVEIRIQ